MNYLFICAAVIGINPGDFILTRNAGDERNNPSPGWWNHSAVYIGDGKIVEAIIGKGVILSNLKDLWDKKPYVLVLRPKDNSTDKARAVSEAARRLVGQSYKKQSSIWFFLFEFGEGNNCVTVLRKCYCHAYGGDPWWTKPDDIAVDWKMMYVESKGLQK